MLAFPIEVTTMNLKFLLSSISMAIAAGAASAATVHVRANAAAPAAPYDSWANACGDVATAVSYAAANGADTVLVTNGTYSLSSTISIADAITLRSVEGAGATILDGQGQVRALAVNHAGAVVSGFTVTNGWAAAGGHGGGILVGHGTVERCVVTGCTTADGYGGGIRIDNGLVDGCVVTRCLAGGASGNGGAGGGIAVFGGTVRSCLVAANECTGVQGHIGGGGIIAMTTASTIENCTIVRNYDRETFSTDGCGGLYISYGGVSPTIRNCIIRDNEAAGSNDNHDWFVYPGSTYAASFNNVPVALGTDAIPGDPLFVSAGSGCGLNADPGDCHFPFRSPCARTASLQPWMAAARDADGLPRIAPTTTHPDLGAFTVTVEDFECAFSASPGRGMVPLDVSFRSWVDVADIGHAQLTYRWDFNNDGSYESEGASSTAEWNYTVPGTFSPRLRVENAATGKWCEYVATNGVVAAPNTLYVSPDGSETPPYDTLQTATHSLSNALAAAADGMVILVDSGVYPLDATVHVSLGVTIRSLDRTNPAVLDGQGARRCMTLSHARRYSTGSSSRTGTPRWNRTRAVASSSSMAPFATAPSHPATASVPTARASTPKTAWSIARASSAIARPAPIPPVAAHTSRAPRHCAGASSRTTTARAGRDTSAVAASTFSMAASSRTARSSTTPMSPRRTTTAAAACISSTVPASRM
jgi:hypothetical protein